MPELPIDLAIDYGSPSTMAVPMPKPPEEYYPGTRLEFKGSYELPDEGEITFRYRVTRTTEDRKADKCCEEIDFLELLKVKPLKDTSKDSEYAGDKIDALRTELESATEDAGEPGEE